MILSYSKLNSFISKSLSFVIFLFKCFGDQFIIQANKMLIILLSFRLSLTSLTYLNFCGINSSKKRNLCYRYGDHKVKVDLSLVFFQIPERGKK